MASEQEQFYTVRFPTDTSPILPPKLGFEDATGSLHEIYTPPTRYKEAISLYKKQDWEALTRFPRWSDSPPVPPREANIMVYTPGEKGGEAPADERTIWLPRGTAERARLLLIKEDWEALEREFEVYSGQQYELTEEEIEYERGVERMRKARETEEDENMKKGEAD